MLTDGERLAPLLSGELSDTQWWIIDKPVQAQMQADITADPTVLALCT